MLADFKRKWGATPQRLYRYYTTVGRDGSATNGNGLLTPAVRAIAVRAAAGRTRDGARAVAPATRSGEEHPFVDATRPPGRAPVVLDKLL